MTDRGPPVDLVFLHLSDIHFRKGSIGDVHDPDRELRNELEQDLRRLRSTLPRLDGLLITGDIAYSGKPEEYSFAANWIERIRELVDCPVGGIMVTPGNHDVDRDLVPNGSAAHAVQLDIRGGGSLGEQYDRLATALRDPARAASLLQPLSAYNSFARAYDCHIDALAPFWEKTFPLRDNSTLRIRGITTTFLSGPHDDAETGKMLYGAAQRAILREDGVRHVVVGHHPPSWTLEGDIAEVHFSRMTVFQAFGHKHLQTLMRVNNCVKLVAGAVHPERREPQWLPRYSAIALSVVDDRHLSLRVYPRRWSDEEFEFIPDFDSQARATRDFVLEVAPVRTG